MEKTVLKGPIALNEPTAKDQVLKDIGELIEDLINKITENVDETKERASFTVKCELSTSKYGDHIFEISGKTSLSTPKITRGAKIIDRQLTLFEM